MKKIVRNLLLVGLLLVGLASGTQVQQAAAATTIGTFGYDQNNGTTLNDGEADLAGSGADTWNYNGGDTEHFTAYNRDGVTVQPAASVKKSVKETSTQGLFDVSLAIRGNSQVVNTPVDIAIVMDYSSTMDKNPQKLANAIAGVNEFVDELSDSLNKDEVRIAIVAYNRTLKDTGGFLTDATKLKAFLKEVKLDTSSGTFVQEGLLRAQNMLMADSTAQSRILVHVGDGEANRAYSMSGVEKTTPQGSIVPSGVYQTPAGLDTYQTVTGTPIIATYISDKETSNADLTYDKTAVDTVVKNTMGTILDLRSNPDIITFSVGVAPEKHGDFLARNIADKPSYYREIDGEMADLSEALGSIAAQIDDTIPNGTVIDPLGSGLLLASSFQANDPSWTLVGQERADQQSEWQPETDAQLTNSVRVSAENGQIKMTGIELGANQQLILTYQVRIDTEANNFKPETWLLTNGRTTLDPTSEGQEAFDFPIPSVKAPGVELSLIKLWQDQNNHLGQRPDQVQVNLTRGKTTDETAWTTSAPLTLSAADQWQKTISQVSLTDGTDVYLPKFNNQGEDFIYSMTEATKLPDYQTSVQTKGNTITLTNTLDEQDPDTDTNTDQDGQDPDDDQGLTNDDKRPDQAGKLPQAGESQMPANLLVSGVVLLALVIWGIVSLIRHKRTK
ncbi:VWA domain-containing protein [Lapidilactobacillus luobeiensis]|uniref:VWA domain-containing protein n=1 Tax=Lapidilactobacillus luobeiensis TaxID=2950371 RepID=UPI0021C3DC94|nr:VWA domain-containing protein [Lapidilactobacillus luobeiensis]